VGKAEVRRTGRRIALLAFGSVLEAAEKAGDELDATVVNMRFVRPLDESLLTELATSHVLLVTVEDNAVHGGAGSAVNEWLTTQGHLTPVHNIGLPDRFLEHGSREELLAEAGLDAPGIVASVHSRMGGAIAKPAANG
jgi:1-deoxy-D-xylulose-5-phosphate synthase